MSDLTEFLRARIAEDEAVARGHAEPVGVYEVVNGIEDHPHDGLILGGPRLVAECETKQRIVAAHRMDEKGWASFRQDWCVTCGDVRPCPTLRALASVYAAHPDYRQEWRP